MRKLLPAALVALLAGFPLLAVLAVVSMASQAAETCQPATLTAGGVATGPVTRLAGETGSGSVTVATANIPARVGLAGFNASLPRVLATQPDFVALQEVGRRTLAQIEAAAPGYVAFRDPTPDTGPGSSQAMNSALLWRDATWARLDAGRITIVDDDRAYFGGRRVVWDRYATWATLHRRSDGTRVSVVSVHHMTNPKKYPRQHGHPALSRIEQYGQGMDTLLTLVGRLESRGPVLLGGDLNTPASYRDLGWSAAAKFTAAEYAWATHGVDYIAYPRGLRLMESWTGTMRSDHQWVAARLDLTGTDGAASAGPCLDASPMSSTSCPSTGSPAEQGLTPDALLVLRSVDATFGTHQYLGVGDRPTNPDSDHPTGRAVDILIDQWDTAAGIAHGTQIVAWFRAHARELGVTYLIWRREIWSTGDSRWRPYTHPSGGGGATLEHLDHVHVSVAGTRGARTCGAGSGTAGRVVYPVPAAYIDADRHNWHASGSHWAAWHTGTDFTAPCGVPVYAAHDGTIEIDTATGWAGPWLVKITTGPASLATWYAHLQSLDVARAHTVSAGQRIGTVGAAGNATGCHLHFEVHLRNGPIYGGDNTDPSVWLAQHAATSEGVSRAA